ncbi:wd repeat protein [Venturia nashicola]|uniref:Wd repeat protein n=1 Tax=Venturia nashicola TaxID=86259 RepID=A0A4Z1P0Q7_9PEZI|nr:wd repeat protein [Venturia nashicola]
MSSPPPTTAASNASDGATSPSRQSNRVGLDTEEDHDEEDDDMDFMPARERRHEDEEEESFESASEGLSGIDIEFQVLEEGEEILDDEDDDDEDSEDDEEEEEGAGTETGLGATIDRAGGGRSVFVPREQIAQLLGTNGLRRLLARGAGGIAPFLGGVEDDEDDDEDDDDFDPRMSRRTRSSRRPPRQPVEFEKVPSEAGRKLMLSGTFGWNERGEDSFKRRKKLASRLVRREMGLGGYGRQKARDGLLRQDLIPASKADTIIHYRARCYSGQFSTDGNFFFSCGQDFKVRMYDTSNPYSWKYYKVVDNPHGQWTITDASLSADNRWLAYSSISRLVCLASTEPSDSSQPQVLDFSRLRSGSGAPSWAHRAHSHFGIWSIRFSGDGKEIVAGTGDHSVYVFDIERNESILRIEGHDDDVNAVCFGDAASPHILYSGSDDTTLKVWDRRSLGDGRAAGTFLGHTEGLTYVDSKGDGRYIISNGKDQTAKLWDLRRVIPTEVAEKVDVYRHTTGFEYRMNAYNFNQWRPHPHDCSLVTFRDHSVLKTLIRCHFSPLGSTDSRYVYSGSYDGKVYIWNMDATLKGTIDVAEATRHLRANPGRDDDDGVWGYGGHGGFSTCVRDASWHPDVPLIAATSWNGYGSSLGTCSVHSWSDGADEDDEGMPRKEHRVDARLVPERVWEPSDNDDGIGPRWFGRRL